MPKTTGHSHRTLKGVFKKIAVASGADTAAFADETDGGDSFQSHERSFHEFLDLPAFEGFRMEGATNFTTDFEILPENK